LNESGTDAGVSDSKPSAANDTDSDRTDSATELGLRSCSPTVTSENFIQKPITGFLDHITHYEQEHLQEELSKAIF